MAVRYGGFPEILATFQCDKTVEALCAYLDSELAATAQHGVVFTSCEGRDVVTALAEYDDPGIERTFAALASRSIGVQSKYDGALESALAWLVKRRLHSVIPIITHGLHDDEVYYALAGTSVPMYLNAVSNELHVLSGQDDSSMLRRRAKAHAELILLEASGDVAQRLMEYAGNVRSDCRLLAIDSLIELRDERVIVWAKNVAERDLEWPIIAALIRLIGYVPSDKAKVALEELRNYSFDQIPSERKQCYVLVDETLASVCRAQAHNLTSRQTTNEIER